MNRMSTQLSEFTRFPNAASIADVIRSKIRATQLGCAGPPFYIHFLPGMLLSFPFSDIFYFLLVNLPTIIESTKTYDSRTFCKTGDISQVCVFHS